MPHGPTDKASDFESEDWGFESLCGRVFARWKLKTEASMKDSVEQLEEMFGGTTHISKRENGPLESNRS